MRSTSNSLWQFLFAAKAASQRSTTFYAGDLRFREEMRIFMVDRITDETIEYVGVLAKLELSDDEKRQAKQDMSKMLNYIDKLNELDTSDIEPMSHVFALQNVFRADVVTNGDGHRQTLENAPGEKNNMFMVPKTFA